MVSAFRTILQDKSEDIQIRRKVAWALTKQNSLNSDVVSVFRTILQDKSEDIQIRKYVLDFGKRIEWYDKEAYSERLIFLIRDSFKENLDWRQKHLICSLRVEIDLRLEDLPKERWNNYTISTLGCVKPSDTRIHKELLRILKDISENIEIRISVTQILVEQNSLNSDLVSDFYNYFKRHFREYSDSQMGGSGFSRTKLFKLRLGFKIRSFYNYFKRQFREYSDSQMVGSDFSRTKLFKLRLGFSFYNYFKRHFR